MIDAIFSHYNAPYWSKMHKDFQKNIQSVTEQKTFIEHNFSLARCQSPSIDNSASVAISNIEPYFQSNFSIFLFL